MNRDFAKLERKGEEPEKCWNCRFRVCKYAHKPANKSDEENHRMRNLAIIAVNNYLQKCSPYFFFIPFSHCKVRFEKRVWVILNRYLTHFFKIYLLILFQMNVLYHIVIRWRRKNVCGSLKMHVSHSFGHLSHIIYVLLYVCFEWICILNEVRP